MKKLDFKSLIIGVLLVLLVVFLILGQSQHELLQSILVVSTVIYVIFTAMLFWENRKMRELQTEPELAITIEPRDNWVGILDVYIENVGAGIATDIKLMADRDFPTLKEEYPISEISYFKNGINCLAHGRKLRLFSTISSLIPKHHKDMPFRINAIYENRFGRKLNKEFFVDFSQFSDISQIGKPVIYEIAENFKELQKDIHNLSVLLEDLIGGSDDDKIRRWLKS